jgi:hypothetical protein
VANILPISQKWKKRQKNCFYRLAFTVKSKKWPDWLTFARSDQAIEEKLGAFDTTKHDDIPDYFNIDNQEGDKGDKEYKHLSSNLLKNQCQKQMTLTLKAMKNT